MAPRSEVPDTSVLITVVREAPGRREFLDRVRADRVWLSTVVAAELYAGTRSRDDAHAIDRVVATMERLRRLLVPTADDWIRAGRLLARRTRLQGAIRPRDHLSDVLILLSAARLKGTVVTDNVRHLDMWAELARTAGLDVTVTPSQAWSIR
ncbi:MAG: PIN domain-containing protein [Chloroflexi bacterium]|nr:PIN domain-containing protein [Chloroflexota bacterium]